MRVAFRSSRHLHTPALVKTNCCRVPSARDRADQKHLNLASGDGGADAFEKEMIADVEVGFGFTLPKGEGSSSMFLVCAGQAVKVADDQ